MSLNKADQKILISIVVSLTLFVALIALIYRPRLEALKVKTVQMTQLSKEIQRIEFIAAGSATLEEGIAQINREAALLETKFPAKEEDALQKMSDYARDLNVTLTSTSARPRQPCQIEGQAMTLPDGRVCQRVPVSIQMKAEFYNLVQYLEKLKDDLPAYMTVEKLMIRMDEGAPAQLKMHLDIQIYLVS